MDNDKQWPRVAIGFSQKSARIPDRLQPLLAIFFPNGKTVFDVRLGYLAGNDSVTVLPLCEYSNSNELSLVFFCGLAKYR